MILVTGATGTVGSELVKRLGEGTWPFRALVRSAGKASGIRQAGGEVAEGELGRPETLDAALEGVDTVFLLSSEDRRQAELQGSLVEAARRAGVRNFVKLSVMGADAGSPIAFMRWHRETEEQIERSGMAFTHLRPGSFMQNFLAEAGTIKSQGMIRDATGEGKTAFIDVRDIAACAVVALTGDRFQGMAVELTGPEELSGPQVAQKLSAATGKVVRYVNISIAEKKRAMLASGMPDFLVEDLVRLTELVARGGGERVCDGVERMLGREPQSFDLFARDHAAAFR
jgi:uncharacterized protein YbjT (DUF2867 family)